MTLFALPPQLLARLAVEGELGRGGYGVVYAVRARADGRALALKWLPESGDEARGLREVEALHGVAHPHVMVPLEGGRLEGGVYLLMERAEGSLSPLLDDPGRLPETWRFLRQAIRGVAALHRAGLVHRDLKPSNILLVGDQARVADFGLVRPLEAATLTAEGVILGTPGYLAPEQARGERVTPAADTFALGTLLFRALTGRLPVTGRGAMELVLATARDQIEPAAVALGGYPPALGALVAACLAPRPEDRPGDLEALAAALPELQGARGEARPTLVAVAHLPATAPRGRAPPAPSARPPWVPWVLGGVGAALLGGLAASRPAAPAPPAPPPPALRAPERVLPEGLGEDFGGSLRRALELEDAGLPGPPPDPLDWRIRVEALPVARRFLVWVIGGGRPEELPEDWRRDLATVGARLEARGVASPFAPFLDLYPGEVPPDSAAQVLRDRVGGEAAAAVALEGWLATALARAAALERERPALEATCRDLLRGEFPASFSPQLVARVGMGLSFVGEADFEEDPLKVLDRLHRMGPRVRAAAAPVIRSQIPDAEALLAALGRAARAEGTQGQVAALLGVGMFNGWRRLFLGAVMRHELPGLLGGAPQGLPSACFMGALAYERAVLRNAAGHDEAGARAQALEWLAMAASRRDPGPFAGRLHESAVLELISGLSKWVEPGGARETLAQALAALPPPGAPGARSFLEAAALHCRNRGATHPKVRDVMLPLIEARLADAGP